MKEDIIGDIPIILEIELEIVITKATKPLIKE